MINEEYPEFKLTKTRYLNPNVIKATETELNRSVYEFKEENPEYELFNIIFVRTGTAQGYMVLFWRKIKL